MTDRERNAILEASRKACDRAAWLVLWARVTVSHSMDIRSKRRPEPADPEPVERPVSDGVKKRQERGGCVYLIEHAGRFTIGTAGDTQQYLKSLRSATVTHQGAGAECEYRLLCAVWMENPLLLATSLHRQYHARRVTEFAGDWFCLTREEASEVSASLLRVYREEQEEAYYAGQALVADVEPNRP